MKAYRGAMIVFGGLFLATVLVFLALSYIKTYPVYVTLGVAAVAFFIRWAKDNLFKEEEPRPVRRTKNQEIDNEFDAWMGLNSKDR